MARLAKAAAFWLAAAGALLLAGCAGTGIGMGAQPTITQNSNDAGDVELVLDPIDVWDDASAGEAEQLEVNGQTLTFRVREDGGAFKQSWVRMGLFWHSRKKDIIVPVVVSGPPVEIKSIRVEADGGRETLKPAQNFSFEPGRRVFDSKLSSGAFLMSPDMLARIVSAKEVAFVVITNRGGLRAYPQVTLGSDERSLRASAKAQFAEFNRQRALYL